MTLRQIAERFGVARSVARRWLLKEGYEFVEVRDRQRGNQVVAALPIDIAADALHRRNKQGFAVVGLKAEKGIVTEDELRAQAVLQDVTSAESRRRARERDDWVDEVSGYILDEKDHGAFAEAADYIQDIEKFVSEAIEHSDGYGNTFDLIGIVRTIVDDYGRRLRRFARRRGEHGFARPSSRLSSGIYAVGSWGVDPKPKQAR